MCAAFAEVSQHSMNAAFAEVSWQSMNAAVAEVFWQSMSAAFAEQALNAVLPVAFNTLEKPLFLESCTVQCLPVECHD